MEISLNGKPHQLGTVQPVTELLQRLGFGSRPVLVEVNQHALLASEHASTQLHGGEVVEIIQIVAGG